MFLRLLQEIGEEVRIDIRIDPVHLRPLAQFDDQRPRPTAQVNPSPAPAVKVQVVDELLRQGTVHRRKPPFARSDHPKSILPGVLLWSPRYLVVARGATSGSLAPDEQGQHRQSQPEPSHVRISEQLRHVGVRPITLSRFRFDAPPEPLRRAVNTTSVGGSGSADDPRRWNQAPGPAHIVRGLGDHVHVQGRTNKGVDVGHGILAPYEQQCTGT